MNLTGNRKINPRRCPISLGEREARARKQAIETAWAIFFTVLRDKEWYSEGALQRVWKGVENLSGSIAKGYITAKELAKVLEEEAGINLR